MIIRRITITGKPGNLFCKAYHDCGYIVSLAPVVFTNDVDCPLTGKFMFKSIIRHKLWERPKAN